MDLLRNIKDFFVPPEDGDDELYDENMSYNSRQERGSSERGGSYSSRDMDNEPDRSDMSYGSSRSARAERFEHEEGRRSNKVVNIQTTAQLQVVLVKPEVFTDAKQIADHLIAKKTVVLNLETASAETKRRIIDFLVGVAYANGGSLKPVANMTYIITPYNVGFIGEDLVGELENNGVII